MDPQQIKAIIDAMASSDFTEMEFSQDGWTLRLVRRAAGEPATLPVRPQPGLPRPALGPSTPTIHAAIQAPARRELQAPLYGVVHLQPSPGEPPFVTAGMAVVAGQTLCVIEAMKVFNEVRAEHDATVEAVLVSSGQEVEAGQPLLRLA